ncbi:hypothetical protein GALMADRAFT_77528 [Galerina marginata CBS 339.88]|uniref:ABC transporter domain-containing protein n=1 Tax=Galerina marginata (strain CBS 339.88) TaxID=685588 RepID=A0A067SR49_GALM3|nr:hypothetical protein GALMADRAFT_77528 [Galerina marginata CBS 339.88]
MNRRIEFLRNAQQANDFLSIFKRVRTFYKILDQPSPYQCLLEYPFHPNTGGCKITIRSVIQILPVPSTILNSFSNVSLNYGSSKTPAVSDVSFTIEPGQFIVIAGKNGSGKTSLLKLLTGLVQPTDGEISIDDTTLCASTANKFRQAVTFVTQSEAIYPVSLRENLLLGLTNKVDRASVTDEDLNEAVRLGGAVNLIERRGYSAILNPVTITSESIEDPAGKAAIEARDYGSPNPVGTPFSTGEHQRFIASRAFLRIKHSKIKLIILDEPSNALDPQAEAQVFREFRKLAKEKGQTLIVVTHRLTSVAPSADLILCMNEGKIEEKGTHYELIKSGGLYSALYNVQAPT